MWDEHRWQYTCDSLAALHICPRCYDIAKHLFELYGEEIEKQKQIKMEQQSVKAGEEKPKKKRGRPKKKKEMAVKAKKVLQKIEREKIKKEKSDEPMLKKCWTCEFGFLGKDGDVACTEGKVPETCGQE